MAAVQVHLPMIEYLLPQDSERFVVVLMAFGWCIGVAVVGAAGTDVAEVDAGAGLVYSGQESW